MRWPFTAYTACPWSQLTETYGAHCPHKVGYSESTCLSCTLAPFPSLSLKQEAGVLMPPQERKESLVPATKASSFSPWGDCTQVQSFSYFNCILLIYSPSKGGTHHSVHVEIRRQLAGGFHFPLSGPCRSNLGHLT